MQITLYSTTTCPYCRMLKDYLARRSLPFEEKLVDLDDDAKDKMLAESGGFLGVPFTVIVKEDGEKEKIIGFDVEKLDRVLGYNKD
jgi:glutaredoxin